VRVFADDLDQRIRAWTTFRRKDNHYEEDQGQNADSFRDRDIARGYSERMRVRYIAILQV
jgi:hypothetical protein